MKFGNFKWVAKQEILWLRKYVWKYMYDFFGYFNRTILKQTDCWSFRYCQKLRLQFNRKFQVHAFISETKKYMKNMKMWINQTKKLYVRFEFVLKFTAKITKENVRKKTNESNFDFPIVKFTISKFS